MSREHIGEFASLLLPWYGIGLAIFLASIPVSSHVISVHHINECFYYLQQWKRRKGGKKMKRKKVCPNVSFSLLFLIFLALLKISFVLLFVFLGILSFLFFLFVLITFFFSFILFLFVLVALYCSHSSCSCSCLFLFVLLALPCSYSSYSFSCLFLFVFLVLFFSSLFFSLVLLLFYVSLIVYPLESLAFVTQAFPFHIALFNCASLSVILVFYHLSFFS